MTDTLLDKLAHTVGDKLPKEVTAYQEMFSITKVPENPSFYVICFHICTVKKQMVLIICSGYNYDLVMCHIHNVSYKPAQILG